MLPLLLVAALLSGTPAKKPAKHPKATAAKTADLHEGLEMVVPERMLEDLLQAALPVTRTVTRDVALLGFSQSVELKVTLKNPKVKVTPAAIYVALDFDVSGPGGIATSGQATPRFELTVLDGKDLVEGKLTGATLGASGVELPVTDLVEPIHFPAGASGPIDAAGVTVQCEGAARKIVLEKGQVRITGGWHFARAPKP